MRILLNKRHFISGIIAVLFGNCLAGASESVTLTDNGFPASVIILPERPTRAAQFAAFELQYLVKLMTETELPIVKEGESFSGLPIRIGSRDSAGNPEKFLPEEYWVSVTAREIVLSGMDDPDYGIVHYENPRTFPSCSYTRKATTYAVYEFLERACGMRFYFFGDEGIFFIPRKKLSVELMQIRRRPAMTSSRWIEINHPPTGTSTRDLALLEARWRKSAVNGHVNHNTWSIYFRYWDRATGNFYGSLPELFREKRPDYFAQGHSGKSHLCAVANKFPGDANLPPQLCPSSDGPVDYFAEEALEMFHGKTIAGARLQPPRFKGIRYYYPLMEDDNKYWCLCPQCKKMFPEVASEQRAGYIHFDWINRIARKAAKLEPELNFITCAYSNSLLYPDPAILKLEPNIAVRLCLAIDSWYHPEIYNWQHSVYKQWIVHEASKRQISVWCYLLSPGFEARTYYRYGDFIPLLYPWKVGKIFQEFVGDGIQGYFAEADLSTQFLEAYIINRIAWEGKDADPEHIIADYFRNYYGSAAEPMQEFYRKMEEITYNPASYPKDTMQEFRKTSFCGGEIHTERNNLNLLTDITEKQLDSLIRKASSIAEYPVEKRRVAWFSDRVWEQAKNGRREFVKREQRRNTQPPTVHITKTVETNGAVAAVDFSKAGHLKLQYPLSGTASNGKGSLDLCHDSQYLYLRYSELGSEAFLNRKENIWMNNIELFAGYLRNYPFAHFAVAPDGTMELLQHEIEGGVPRISSRKIHVRIVNELTEHGWTATLAIPLKTLLPDRELAPGKRFFLNVMRTCRFINGNSYSWSPLGGNGSYVQSLDRMGKVYLSE